VERSIPRGDKQKIWKKAAFKESHQGEEGTSNRHVKRRNVVLKKEFFRGKGDGRQKKKGVQQREKKDLTSKKENKGGGLVTHFKERGEFAKEIETTKGRGEMIGGGGVDMKKKEIVSRKIIDFDFGSRFQKKRSGAWSIHRKKGKCNGKALFGRRQEEEEGKGKRPRGRSFGINREPGNLWGCKGPTRNSRNSEERKGGQPRGGAKGNKKGD